MRPLICLISLITIVVLQSCSNSRAETKEVKKESASIASFKIATVASGQPEFTISLPGELMPYEQVHIYPKVKGFVKKIYADRGSYVSKGQLLALLEAPEMGAEYAAKEAASNQAYQKYLFSKQSYYRLKEAAKKAGAVATIKLEKAYAQLLSDSAAYQSSRSISSASGQLNKYLQIRAPFSGIITGRYISEGALVGDNTAKEAPVFQLAQQEKLRLTIAIPEKEAQSLPAGTKADFSVIDLPGKTFTATLSRSSGALDIASRSIIAEFDVPNNNAELKAGQYAKVSIRLRRSMPTLWVPATSVVQSQSGKYVINADNGVARRIPIHTGISRDSMVEVFGNLQEGQMILQKGSEEIKEGSLLNKN